MSDAGEAGGRAAGGSVKIAYCDGRRLRRVLLAAAEHLATHRSELDRINVFPVADGDTGTNLSLTMRSVADALRPLETDSAGEVASVAAEACVLGARGNSGMLVAHYLLGFSRSIGDRERLETAELAGALESAAAALEEALEQPVEGTILTVARQAALTARETAREVTDLDPWLRRVRESAREALLRTRETLPILREAGVVDAGAKGFVALLEGVLRCIDGRPPGEGVGTEGPLGMERPPDRGEGEGRYCTQLTYRGEGLYSSEALRERVRPHGTSVIVVRTGDLAKIHVHADDPAAVEASLAELGTPVQRRVEDTRAPVEAGRTVAVVTDSSADLPSAWAREHGVEVVPLQIVVGDRTYRDGEELGPTELLELLRDPETPRPTTSQATPGAFLEAYRRALDGGARQLLGVFLSGAVSGTLGSARAAAERLELADRDRRIVDSRTGSLGLGMRVVRAVELLEQGASLEEAAEEVERLRDRSNLFFAVEDLEGLRRSGRVSRSKAWLGDLLGLLPVLTLDDGGRVVPHARVRGRAAARDRILAETEAALEGRERYRVGVVHAGIPAFARELAEEIRERWRPVEVHVAPLTAVITAHLGRGAWGVCYQIEDG